MRYFTAIVVALLLLNACNNETTEKATTEVSQEEYVDKAHNSQNSLEYWGTYTGKLPCADCDGIKIQMILTERGEFKRKMSYIGKDKNLYEEKGKYKWQESGNVIELQNVEHPRLYKVGENSITQLDKDGEVIEGELARMYVLHKQR